MINLKIFFLAVVALLVAGVEAAALYALFLSLVLNLEFRAVMLIIGAVARRRTSTKGLLPLTMAVPRCEVSISVDGLYWNVSYLENFDFILLISDSTVY